MLNYKGYTIAETHYGEYQLRYMDEIHVFKSLAAAKAFVNWTQQVEQPIFNTHLCQIYNFQFYKDKRHGQN